VDKDNIQTLELTTENSMSVENLSCAGPGVWRYALHGRIKYRQNISKRLC